MFGGRVGAFADSRAFRFYRMGRLAAPAVFETWARRPGVARAWLALIDGRLVGVGFKRNQKAPIHFPNHFFCHAFLVLDWFEDEKGSDSFESSFPRPLTGLAIPSANHPFWAALIGEATPFL